MNLGMMTLTIWTVTTDQGDGSVFVQIFASEKEATDYEEAFIKDQGHNFAEPTATRHSLQFDTGGKLINGMEPYEDKTDILPPLTGLYWQADPPEEPGFFLHIIEPSKVPKCFIIYDHSGELKALLAGVYIPVKDIDAKNPTGLWLGPIPGPDNG